MKKNFYWKISCKKDNDVREIYIFKSLTRELIYISGKGGGGGGGKEVQGMGINDILRGYIKGT